MSIDARLSSEWLNAIRFDNLSDTAWRVFTGALMWSAGNGTDGIIPNRYLKMLHPDGVQSIALKELEIAGFWTRTEDGYVFHDWDTTLHQSTADEISNYRAKARERQQRSRDRKKDAGASVAFSEPVTSDVPSDVTRDVTSDVTGGITRDVGKGKGKGSGIEEVAEERETTTWETATIPDTKACRVCGKAIPAASPVNVCARQDSEHNFARSNKSTAA